MYTYSKTIPKKVDNLKKSLFNISKKSRKMTFYDNIQFMNDEFNAQNI